MEMSESASGPCQEPGFGIPELDAADQRLIAVAQTVNQAIADGGEARETQRLMNQLMLEAFVHFETEERILMNCAYPEARGHAALHQQMKAELLHAMEQLADVAARASWAEYGLLVTQLVINHFHQETAKFREFLRSGSTSDSQDM